MIRWLLTLRARWRAARSYDWRHVPEPNWRCRRGGKDYI